MNALSARLQSPSSSATRLPLIRRYGKRRRTCWDIVIHHRLAAGDSEAISQALNTVRRVIKAFADAVFPATDVPAKVGDQSVPGSGSDKVLNRIKVYVTTGCTSASRSDRLTRNLRQIYERASVGSHGDVTAEEAQALFLQTYLTLGEILVTTTVSAKAVV